MVGGLSSAINAYWTYQLKNIEPVQVTTISKECHLYKFICLTQETKDTINLDDWDIISRNNQIITENCPNIEKPNCKDIIAARKK